MVFVVIPYVCLGPIYHLKSSTFDDGKSISRIAYVVSWVVVHGISYKGIFLGVDFIHVVGMANSRS